MTASDLRREWADNPRLRLGAVFIVALLWVYGLLMADERLAARNEEIARLDQELSLLSSQARGQEWLKLHDRAVRRLSEFRERVWREESEGRIQAAFQDWLRGVLEIQRVTPQEMNVALLAAKPPGESADAPSPLAGLPPEMRVARARLVMEFQPRALAALLAAINTQPHWIWVERLAIRNWGSPQVELELGALFAVGARDKS